MKSFVEFGKTVWRESRGRTVSVITKATVVCNVHFRADDILRVPGESRWTVEEDEKKRKVPGQRETSLNCKQVTAKKLERRSLIQTVVDDVRDSTVGKCESRFTPYLSVLGPVQTSNFTCAEPNTSLDRPKLLSSTVDSDGRTLHVPNLIRGEKKYHPYCLK